MTLLSAAEAAAIQRDVAGVLPDTCRVIRRVETGRDTRNNPVYAEQTVEQAPCLLSASSSLQSREAVIADRLGWTAPYRITMVDTIADTEDVIAIGDRRFEVGAVVKAAAIGLTTTVIVQERG